MREAGKEQEQEQTEKLVRRNEELSAEVFELRQEVTALRREFNQQNEARLLFFANLAHELRTSLTPILGSTRLLKEEVGAEPGGAQDRLINSIIRGSESLEERVTELLDLAKFQEGAFSLEIVSLDITALISDYISQFLPLVEDRRLSLTADLPPKLTLKADKRRIGQVILNLLENAVKFTPEGGSIEVKALADGGEVVLEVHNSGRGLTAEQRQKLFQPYYRAEADRQGIPGSGLGLAVCKQLVEAHGGRIWVADAPGDGITFLFRVPVGGPPDGMEEPA